MGRMIRHLGLEIRKVVGKSVGECMLGRGPWCGEEGEESCLRGGIGRSRRR